MPRVTPPVESSPAADALTSQVSSLQAEYDKLVAAFQTERQDHVAALEAHRVKVMGDLDAKVRSAEHMVAGLRAEAERVRADATLHADTMRAEVAALTAEKAKLGEHLQLLKDAIATHAVPPTPDPVAPPGDPVAPALSDPDPD